MSKSGDGQPNQISKPKSAQPVAVPDQPMPKPKRRPSKTRQLAWARIDGGKGTWKPK